MNLLSKHLKPVYTESRGKKPDFQLDIDQAQFSLNLIEEMSKVAHEVGLQDIHLTLRDLVNSISNDYLKYFRDFTSKVLEIFYKNKFSDEESILDKTDIRDYLDLINLLKRIT